MQTALEGKETKNNDTQETKTAFHVVHKLGLACLQNCIRLKRFNNIPCLNSEIPSIEVWLVMREEWLSTGTFTERQADACTMAFVQTKNDATVQAAMRDQMIYETHELAKRSHSSPFVFVKITEINAKPSLLLFELALLHRDTKCFTTLSKAQRQPLLVYDPL